MINQNNNIIDEKRELPELSEDIVITMERTDRFGDIMYKLTINGNGEVIYKGIESVETLGMREAKIPKEKVGELVDEFYRVNFFALEDSYDPTRYLKSTITSIKINGKAKTVRNQQELKYIKELSELNNKIDEVADSERWVYYTSDEERQRARKDLQKRMEERKKIKIDEDTVIKLEKSSSWLGLIYKLTISGDGKIIYEGGKDAKIVGKKTAKISKKRVEELVDEFYRINFFALEDKYEDKIRDGGRTVISIKIHGKEKSVSAQFGLGQLADKIDKLTNSKKWVYYTPAEEKKRIEKEKRIKEKEDNEFKKRLSEIKKERDLRQIQQKGEPQLFLKEIKKILPLAWKEEKKLWNKIIKTDGNKELEEQIFRSKLNLVVSIAKKHYKEQPFFTLLELIKEGEKIELRDIENSKAWLKRWTETREKFRDYPKYLRRIRLKSMRFKDGDLINYIEREMRKSIDDKYLENRRKYFQNKKAVSR